MAFVLAVGYGRDDATSDKDQWTVFRHITSLFSDILFSLAFIGRRASVGGLAGLADCLCVLGAIDNPPGRVWIDSIRRTVEDSQSIVAVSVTGSLVSPTLFSCRDANCT